MPFVPPMDYHPVFGSGDLQESFDTTANNTLPAGWTNAPDAPGGVWVVQDGKLTTSSPSGADINVSHAFAFTDQFTVKANITEGSGFAGLHLRYTQDFLIGSNGALSSGYGFGVYRGDQNYNNSAVVIRYNGLDLANLPSSFQFGPALHVQATFQTSGEISGFIWDDDGHEFDFDYVGSLPALAGDRFALQNGAPPDYNTRPTVDDLFLDDHSGAAWLQIEDPTAKPLATKKYGDPMGSLTVVVDGTESSLTAYFNGQWQGSALPDNFKISPDKAWYQCTELIVRYAGLLGLPSITNTSDTGHGKDTASNFANKSDGHFTFVSGSNASELPAPGAVLSLAAWADNSFGHVGIVQSIEVNGSSARALMFEQNIQAEYDHGTWKTVEFTKTAGGQWVGVMTFTSKKGVVTRVPVAGWAQPVGG